jgi:plasmid replication initiation protein
MEGPPMGTSMTATKQLDRFVAFGDVPLRDDKEAMSVPLVSLSKKKRTKPIEWRSSDGQYVRVTANATHGMATIWDMDILIWAVSQITAAINEGRPYLATLTFHPHDMLKAIGRNVGGTDYQDLEEALRRLKGTSVETNIRIDGEIRKGMFGLLEDWRHDTDEATKRSKRMTLTLPRWIYDGAVKHDVLAIPPAYFDLKSGTARFLYRVARRHAGKQPAGFRLAMKNLHARSGSTRAMKDFALAVRKVVEEQEKQGFPEYRLDLIEGQRGDEVLAMVRDPARVAPPQRRDLAKTALPPAPCSMNVHGGLRAAGHGGLRAKTRGITR